MGRESVTGADVSHDFQISDIPYFLGIGEYSYPRLPEDGPEFTADQISDFTRRVTEWARENPNATREETCHVWQAACEWVKQENQGNPADPVGLKINALIDAQIQSDARKSHHRLRQIVRDAVAAGMSESEAARQVGVTRMTIRAWRGK